MFASSRSRSSVLAVSSSSARSVAPTTAGASEFEKRYGPAALAQQADHLPRAGGAAAEGPAERLAERGRDEVRPGRRRRGAPTCPGRSRPMKPVAWQSSTITRGAVLLGQVADLRQRRDGAVHREDAVGHDQPEAAGLRLHELRLEVGHVGVRVDEALRLAQAHPVDDRGVVELVGDDRVVGAEERLEDAAVRVEAGGVEDRVLHPEEGGDPLLELEVQRLRAADEAHARHPVAPLVERAVGGLQQLGVARQAEVVVGAEVEDRLVRAPRRGSPAPARRGWATLP